MERLARRFTPDVLLLSFFIRTLLPGTRDLAPKAKILRCHRHHHHAVEGVAYPWGVDFGPYLVDGWWGGG